MMLKKINSMIFIQDLYCMWSFNNNLNVLFLDHNKQLKLKSLSKIYRKLLHPYQKLIVQEFCFKINLLWLLLAFKSLQMATLKMLEFKTNLSEFVKLLEITLKFEDLWKEFLYNSIHFFKPLSLLPYKNDKL